MTVLMTVLLASATFWWACLGVFLAVVVASILWPVLRAPEPWALADLRGARRLLEQEKERLLRLIKDLDTELQRQAVEPSEHARLRRGYMVEAAAIQRRLDAMAPESATRKTPGTPETTEAAPAEIAKEQP